MDKYGVDTSSKAKTAAAGCPECATATETHGQVTICPGCGSRPFEEVGSGESESSGESEEG